MADELIIPEDLKLWYSVACDEVEFATSHKVVKTLIERLSRSEQEIARLQAKLEEQRLDATYVNCQLTVDAQKAVIQDFKAELQQEREDARRIISLRQDRIDALTTLVTEELRDPEYAAGYSESYVLAFIAAQIKVLREQQGMSQAQLADKIGTQQPGIARLEDCNHTPSIGTLLKIAKAFGLRLKVSFETTESLPFEVAAFNRDSLQRASRSPVAAGEISASDDSGNNRQGLSLRIGASPATERQP